MIALWVGLGIIVYLVAGVFFAAGFLPVEKIKNSDIEEQGMVTLSVVIWPFFLFIFIISECMWGVTKVCSFISRNVYGKE